MSCDFQCFFLSSADVFKLCLFLPSFVCRLHISICVTTTFPFVLLEYSVARALFTSLKSPCVCLYVSVCVYTCACFCLSTFMSHSPQSNCHRNWNKRHNHHNNNRNHNSSHNSNNNRHLGKASRFLSGIILYIAHNTLNFSSLLCHHHLL